MTTQQFTVPTFIAQNGMKISLASIFNVLSLQSTKALKSLNEKILIKGYIRLTSFPLISSSN